MMTKHQLEFYGFSLIFEFYFRSLSLTPHVYVLFTLRKCSQLCVCLPRVFISTVDFRFHRSVYIHGFDCCTLQNIYNIDIFCYRLNIYYLNTCHKVKQTYSAVIAWLLKLTNVGVRAKGPNAELLCCWMLLIHYVRVRRVLEIMPSNHKRFNGSFSLGSVLVLYVSDVSCVLRLIVCAAMKEC